MADKWVNELKKITIEFWQNDEVTIYLFGSMARGEGRRSSDIDIAIDRLTDDNLYKMSIFRELVEESVIRYRVDIVNMCHAGKLLCERIKREGIVWKK